MNLKEQLAELTARAKGLAPKIKAGDADAAKQAEDVMSQIDMVKGQIAEAEKNDALLKSIGALNAGEPASEGGSARARSLGEWAAARVKEMGAGRAQRFEMNLGTFEKAATDVSATPAGISSALSDVQEQIYEGPRRRLQVADLFGQETTTRTSVTYFVESATVDGGPGFTAEGAKKSPVHFADPTPVTEAVHKLTAYYKETEEILDDLPWLATSIENRGIYLVQLKEEDELLNGDGTGNSLSGVLTRSGIQTEAVATGEPNSADAIFRAMTAVSVNSPFTADGIVINPADYQTLRLAKDANNQYYGGGFFSGPYGSGRIMEQPPIWGNRTVVTPAIAKGTVLVGAFRQGGAVIRRQGLSVDIANQNEDDFISNRVTIRIEERLALAVRYPAAFVKVNLAGETA